MKYLILIISLLLLTSTSKAEYRLQENSKTNIDSLQKSIKNLITTDVSLDYDSLIELVVKNRRRLKNDLTPYYHILRKRIEQSKDTTNLSEIYYRMGVNYKYKYVYDSAQYYYLKSLPYTLHIKDYYKLGRLYNELGVVCRKTDRNKEAIDYFVSSIKTTKYSKNYYGKAIAENGIGNIYLVQKEYQKALSYFRESEKYGYSSGNKHHLEISNGSIGETYLNLKQYDSAAFYINKSLESAKIRNNSIGVGICYQFLGEIEVSQKHYNKAYTYFEKALKLQRARKDKRYLSTILVHHGSVCAKLHRYDEAERNLIEGRAISQKIHSVDNMISSNQSLYEVYYNTKRFKEASDALFLSKSYTDTLYNMEKTRVLNDLEYQYQSDRKSQEIELLNTQNELVEKSKKMQRNQFGILLFLIAGLAVFFYYRYQTKQKIARELQRLNEMKSKFFSNISHEFRTPLTLIKGPVEKQLVLSQSEEQRADLQLILRNSDRLLSLVNQLLNLSKIDAGYFSISAQKGDLTSLLKGISNSFNFQASQKDINYEVKIDEITLAWYDTNIVEIIITNLLSNAFKFVPNKGSVQIKVTNHTNNLKIHIANSGCTLTNKELNCIFERFYRAEGTEQQGTGIGLSLVKELCSLYRIPISVNCSSDRIIQFELNLPISKEHFNTTELLSIPQKNTTITNYDTSNLYKDTNSVNCNEDKPVLLVVEDNFDMRKYIKSNFATNFTILEAEDGKIGIKLALEHIPDLIISDVMMPNIGGVELCKFLKTDIKTSHIPIILLTAKVGDENVLGGLKSGADDYITKPFNAQSLTVKVENLIKIRKNLQDKYQKELIINPLNLVFKSQDEKFANTLQEVLNKFLPDPEFSVDQFCKETYMSRTQLHRKLKALTGLSATAFIRSQRIKLAANMMLKPDISVSDVCFATGFNDTSYFSKCFKEIQGQTPTEYIKMNTETNDQHSS
ncbi:response regulator [Ancylomarina sp. 16SWW S1-10-2]|uniref:hybrid sensor histidine kinase/response regulator transcription factor n=1 Tax=Ancylomarina sp. 16SWW S1-10-2 TaxID=2499681 RepID=UPI0012AE64D7|nr:response regulator [Ancylomarina sp. 16SWW S1-10-2]MRT93144.1 tetratricopeptide repeat protein [Ancylomarina sp. 16SWW S1-10-2]